MAGHKSGLGASRNATDSTAELFSWQGSQCKPRAHENKGKRVDEGNVAEKEKEDGHRGESTGRGGTAPPARVELSSHSVPRRGLSRRAAMETLLHLTSECHDGDDHSACL